MTDTKFLDVLATVAEKAGHAGLNTLVATVGSFLDAAKKTAPVNAIEDASLRAILAVVAADGPDVLDQAIAEVRRLLIPNPSPVAVRILAIEDRREIQDAALQAEAEARNSAVLWLDGLGEALGRILVAAAGVAIGSI